MNREIIDKINLILQSSDVINRDSKERFCIITQKGIINKLDEIQDENFDFKCNLFSEFNNLKKINNPKFYWLNYQINMDILDDDYDIIPIKVKDLLSSYFKNIDSLISRTINNNITRSVSLKILKAKIFLIEKADVINDNKYPNLYNFKIPIDINLKIKELKQIIEPFIKEKNENYEIRKIYLFNEKLFGVVNWGDFKDRKNWNKSDEELINKFLMDVKNLKFFILCNYNNQQTDLVKILKKKNYNNNNYIYSKNYMKNYNTYDHINSGLCGLKNIGNTCYMNSALQCLSNTKLLREYFISNEYKDDINNDNVLGYNGKIAISFENLLTNLWKTNFKSYSPNDFKYEISKTNPMFEGYHQNDSQEFLSHLIDCLHEDLNLILKKPMTEQIEKNDINDNDFEIAKKSWINHLKRNYSVINRIFYGQFKSEVNCPKCKKISITFDSFQIIPLSIPQIKVKEINFYVNSDENLVDKICYKLKGLSTTIYNYKLSEMKKNYCESINENPEDYFILNVDANEIADDSKFNIFDIKNSNLDISIFKYSEEDKKILTETPKENQILVKITLIKIAYCMIMEKGSNISDLKKRAINLLKNFLDSNEIKNYEENIEIKKKDYLNSIYEDNEILDDLIVKEIENKYNYISNKKINMLKFDNVIEVHVKFNRNFDDSNKINNFLPSKFPNYSNYQVKYNKNIEFDNNNVKEFNDLYDLIDLFIKKEELDDSNKWYCSTCKDHLKAIKKIDFYKLPPILIIQMKKIKEGGYGRNNNNVDNSISFPFDLDMFKIVKNSKNFDEYEIKKYEINDNLDLEKEDNVEKFIKDNDNLEYELYGVINHFGSMNFGHYTAFCKNEENEWYEYNDSTVRKIDASNVINSSAYILFYKKKSFK